MKSSGRYTTRIVNGAPMTLADMRATWGIRANTLWSAIRTRPDMTAWILAWLRRREEVETDTANAALARVPTQTFKRRMDRGHTIESARYVR